QGRAGRQRLVRVRVGTGEDLEEGVGAEIIGVVTVGIVGEKLVDLLGKDLFGGMGDKLLGTGIGESPGQIGEIAKASIEVADGEQSSVGDDVGGIESDGNRLPMDLGQSKVRGGTRGHEQQASVYGQVVVSYT